MRWLVGVLALALLAPSSGGWASRDFETMPTASAELLVFEIAKCGHCVRFREQFGPRYARSKANLAAPMRFIDIAQQDPDAFPLSSLITVLPTLVLMRDGREVDRLEGYPLPDLVFGMVKRALPAAD